MNFSVISGIIILSVVVGLGETENSVKLDREKRMTNNVFNSFFNLIDSFGSNQNQGQNGGNNNQNGGYNRPNSGNNRPNGGNNRPNGGNNRPNGGNVKQPCSPNNQCDRGYGDCETNQDCRWGLLCGKNNCRGEFGSHSPQGIPWERKDDCCTDNSNYCDPRDRLPSSRRTCCTPSNPCPFSHGDCDTDADCQSGLKCGDNNCKDFHTGAGNKDDCCTYRENGGNQPSGNGGNQPNGGFNRPNGGNNRPSGGNQPVVWTSSNGGGQPNGGLQQCSPNNQCGLGSGDCETDQDCLRGLFCGKNNCKGEFGARAPDGSLWAEKDDCCTNNRHYCNQANLFPWWRRTCCGPSNPCPFKHGDCDKDHDCVSNLVCGDNNCRDFHSNAGNKDDCCTYPNYKKKRSVEGDEISSLPEDEVSKPFNETIDGEEDEVSKPFNETIDRSKRNERFINVGFSSSSGGYRPSNGGFSSSSGGYRPNNGGFSSNNGGNRPNNGGYRPNNGGFSSSNGGFSSNNGGNRPNNGGYHPNNGGFSSNNGGNRPNNGGYRPSNGGFSSSNGGNRPNNGGYRPSNGGFSSNNGGNRPNNGGYRPSNGGFSSNNGGNRPNNGGFTNSNSRPTGGNRPLSGCEASPSFRCCTRERPCSLGGGDCTGDADCQGGLVCGSNNCRKFHPNADKKMDCCAFKKIK